MLNTKNKSRKAAPPAIPQSNPLTGLHREAILRYKMEILLSVDTFLDSSGAKPTLCLLETMANAYFSGSGYNGLDRMARKNQLSQYHTLTQLLTDLMLFGNEYMLQHESIQQRATAVDLKKLVATLTP